MRKFFWIDMEMTGLDDVVHKILEVAVVITDLDLNVLEEYQRVVSQPDEELAKMDGWCTKTHTESGLVNLVKTQGVPLAQVEKELLDLVGRHFNAKKQIVLCGNSVGNDRRFVDRYLPEFAKRLHYRLIDVSSFKEVFREKYGVNIEKKNSHRAVGDIFESINELKTYLGYVNVPANLPKAQT